MTAFTAVDFETADYYADSACAVGIVRVEGDLIAERHYRLIRPPRRRFIHTRIHGITWEQVAGEPEFGELWPEMEPLLLDADFIAAHNAPFDRAVFRACCAACGIDPPALRWECTVRLARKVWDIRPTRLPDVCRRLGIELKHHQALSDAEACARIVLAAQAESVEV